MSHTPKNAIVWTEIPTRDLQKAVAFYSAALGYDLKIEDGGPNELAMIPTAEQDGVAGHIYPGTPAENGNGPTIHLAVPGTLEDGIDAWQKAGGKVLSPAITIPPGRFAYALDLDGNSIGLFEYGSS